MDRPERPRVGRTHDAGGRRLINQATTTVYAATYSAGTGAEYVQTLANAIERGVTVTVILDRGMQAKDGGAVPKALAGALVDVRA